MVLSVVQGLDPLGMILMFCPLPLTNHQEGKDAVMVLTSGRLWAIAPLRMKRNEGTIGKRTHYTEVVLTSLRGCPWSGELRLSVEWAGDDVEPEEGEIVKGEDGKRGFTTTTTTTTTTTITRTTTIITAAFTPIGALTTPTHDQPSCLVIPFDIATGDVYLDMVFYTTKYSQWGVPSKHVVLERIEKRFHQLLEREALVARAREKQKHAMEEVSDGGWCLFYDGHTPLVSPYDLTYLVVVVVVVVVVVFRGVRRRPGLKHRRRGIVCCIHLYVRSVGARPGQVPKMRAYHGGHLPKISSNPDVEEVVVVVEEGGEELWKPYSHPIIVVEIVLVAVVWSTNLYSCCFSTAVITPFSPCTHHHNHQSPSSNPSHCVSLPQCSQYPYHLT